MLASNLKSAILKRGGTAEIADRQGLDRRYAESETASVQELNGTLNGYDVHAFLRTDSKGRQACSYFTIRKIAMRGHHDHSSDYNPGGWTFIDRINWLDTFCPAPKGA